MSAVTRMMDQPQLPMSRVHPIQRSEQRLGDHRQAPVVGGALRRGPGHRELRLQFRPDEQLLVKLRVRARGYWLERDRSRSRDTRGPRTFNW